MMNDVIEELEALRAIYCNEGELEVDQSAVECEAGNVTVRILISNDMEATSPKPTLTLILHIDGEYPCHIPAVSISTQFVTKKNCDILKNELLRYADTIRGNPMLMDLIIWTQENWSRYREHPSKSTPLKSLSTDEEIYWSLLQLDHMRSKAKYTKTILKWTKELNLCGRLVFCDKLILILLQGHESNIKEYIHLQKTVNVDVDSKGRSCKERMLTQLVSPHLTNEAMLLFSDFQILDVASRGDLKQGFEQFGLSLEFNEYVQTLSR